MRLATTITLFGAKLVLFLALTVGFAQAARAESIGSFDSEIVLTKDSSATITETIAYDFGSLEKHGIYRDIPLSIKTQSNKFYNYQFKLISVTRDERKEDVTEFNVGVNRRLRIGNPDIATTGKHIYTIKYAISPTIHHDEAGDYLNLNVFGNSWVVTADSVTAKIKYPEGVELLPEKRCYTGSIGSTNQNCDMSIDGQTVYVANGGALAAGEGMTVNILAKAGSFTRYQIEEDKQIVPALQFGSKEAWRFLILPLISIGIIWLGFMMIRNYFRLKKRRGEQTIIAQYEPPDGLHPAELGLLSDNTADMQEISAMLIDLAVRGYIKIERTDGKGLFKVKDYVFTRLKPNDTDLQAEEALLLTALLGTGEVIELSKVDKPAMALVVDNITDSLTTNLQSKGYFTAKKAFFSADGITDEGYKEWAKVEGFKLFLTVTEKDRMAFHDAPEKNPQLFSKYLPHAIALGVETKWAAQFVSLDIRPAMGWYNNPSQPNFTSIVLANELSKSFSQSVSAGFVPASSGGYGGGGFSGGGGGGGGGGSW